MNCMQGLTKGWSRAAAVASMAVVSGLTTIAVTATPAQTRCLLAGEMRNDIADNDCLEAQRTGCVRRMLTPNQYTEQRTNLHHRRYDSQRI
jgi:hypothetical protein